MNKFIEQLILPKDVPTGYARRIVPHISYNGVDISEDITKHITSLSYTDVLSGYADDLQIGLEDTVGLWHADWFPDMGATLEAVLETRYWDSPDDMPKSIQLGTFEIDEIECKALPSEVAIKAVSVPNNTTLRGVARNRAWEKVSVYKIIEDIAKGAGLEVHYYAPENPNVDRVEQVEQSDLSFLKKLCDDHGLSLKVTDKQLVVFDEVSLESADSVFVFCRELPTVSTENPEEADPRLHVKPISWTFTSAIREVYKSCRVEYQEGQKKEKIVGEFQDPNKTDGKVLVVKQQVTTKAEAEALAKKELRKKNSEEVKAKITLQGRLEYAAGLTCDIKGYGVFDGKYIITQATHQISGGYSVDLELRRCLNGF